MSDAATAVTPRVTGRLLARTDDGIILALPGTDYRLHLRVEQPLAAEVGDLVTGTIHGQARRVDVVPAGGRYIEPSVGRPRRVQGRVVGGDVVANTLLIRAAAVLTVRLMPAQKASSFAIGQLVSFDVERGASFKATKATTDSTDSTDGTD